VFGEGRIKMLRGGDFSVDKNDFCNNFVIFKVRRI